MIKKNVVILGSTGSIGGSTLSVIRQFKNQFRVLGLGVNSNTEDLLLQVNEFKPEIVAVVDETRVKSLKEHLGCRVRILSGQDGICSLASLKEADIVVMAIVGTAAIRPLVAALKAGKTVALANKESLVMAGEIVLSLARQYKAKIIPVDSEQNAIFQCLSGQDPGLVENIYLTASGGPLIDFSKQRLAKVTKRQALAHPRWKMGAKITVDSATLMNKGFEVIEALHLFDMPLDNIKVLIHRQALVHSLVEFKDGSMLAQLGVTDMRLPIQYALTYPDRWKNESLRLDLSKAGALTFEKPRGDKFPCLDLAYEAARCGGMACCALNAANEVAVEAFLKEQISFSDIARVIERVLKKRDREDKMSNLEAVFETDKKARQVAELLVAQLIKRR